MKNLNSLKKLIESHTTIEFEHAQYYIGGAGVRGVGVSSESAFLDAVEQAGDRYEIPADLDYAIDVLAAEYADYHDHAAYRIWARYRDQDWEVQVEVEPSSDCRKSGLELTDYDPENSEWIVQGILFSSPDLSDLPAELPEPEALCRSIGSYIESDEHYFYACINVKSLLADFWTDERRVKSFIATNKINAATISFYTDADPIFRRCDVTREKGDCIQCQALADGQLMDFWALTDLVSGDLGRAAAKLWPIT